MTEYELRWAVEELDQQCQQLYDEGFEEEAFRISDLATKLRMYLNRYVEFDNDRTH